MRRQRLDPQTPFAWQADRPPYPGLASFQEADAAVFFGRQRESQALFEQVANSLVQSTKRFVTVIGPSGSGKSSLVRAGLIPRPSAKERRGSSHPVRPAGRPTGDAGT